MQQSIKSEIKNVLSNTTYHEQLGLFKVFAVAFAVSYDIIDRNEIIDKMKKENISNIPNTSIHDILHFFDDYDIYDVIEWAYQVNRCMEDVKNYTELIKFPNKEVTLELYKILYNKILEDKYQEDEYFFTIYCNEMKDKMNHYAEIEDFDNAIYYRDKLNILKQMKK